MQSITIAEALNYNESYLYKVIKDDSKWIYLTISPETSYR